MPPPHGLDRVGERRQARSPRSGLSVRVRITATVAVLVLAALSVAGFVVYLVEANRLDSQTVQASDRVLDEFAQDPKTQRATSVEAALRSFMGQEVTGVDQIMLGWTDRARFASVDSPVLHDPAFVDAVRPIVAAGGSARLDTPEGPLLVTSQPVTVDGRSGALLVVSNRSEDVAYVHDTLRTYAIVSVSALLLVVVVAFWQSGRLLAPLRTLRQTADEISETDLSRRLPERGNDDITALTHTVNGMLARLEAAFANQREFLDDAGHELRTPLTVLRGHLELLDSDDPTEVAETRELLLDEVDRMARLVGDLIVLAKSERPDFLTPRPADVRALTETVLAKATGLGERRWSVDASAPVTAQVDEQRLTQALLQLADNAVKHTTPGDEVALGSAVGPDGRLRWWVRDTGPGVRPDDAARIFERFGRGATAPEPDDEGFGLGLSIVSAIAVAHGGRAYLDGGGPGARFVVELPATLVVDVVDVV